jgi:hypothetical protein
MPTHLQAHCQSLTIQRYKLSFVKELVKPTQEKKKLKKCGTARQNIMNETATNRLTNHGRKGKTGNNSTFAIGVQLVSV